MEILLTASDSVQLSAQHDVVMDTTVTHLANQDVLNRTAGIAVTGDDSMLFVEAGHDIKLSREMEAKKKIEERQKKNK